jgi:hypothetical protein
LAGCFPLETGVDSSRKSDLSHRGRGSNVLNRSELRVNATFLAKLSNKEIYLKMVLRLGFIRANCPIGNILTPLNFCKVSADNNYKVLFLQGKCKMTPILKNVCPGCQISICQSYFSWAYL